MRLVSCSSSSVAELPSHSRNASDNNTVQHGDNIRRRPRRATHSGATGSVGGPIGRRARQSPTEFTGPHVAAVAVGGLSAMSVDVGSERVLKGRRYTRAELAVANAPQRSHGSHHRLGQSTSHSALNGKATSRQRKLCYQTYKYEQMDIYCSAVFLAVFWRLLTLPIP